MSDVPEVLPGILKLALDRGVTNPPGMSILHGEVHWKCVALTAFWLARHTPKADLEFIFTFAMLHDTMRLDDGADPEHGARAAKLFIALTQENELDAFGAYDQRTLDMVHALTHHVGSTNAVGYDNPNVGLCWDADRLNLWRVGLTPDDRYLTTAMAKTEAAKRYGYVLCERQFKREPFPTWSQIRQEMDECRFP